MLQPVILTDHLHPPVEFAHNHRFQQGLDPYSGTLNHPPPHVYAKAPFSSPQKWMSPRRKRSAAFP